MPELRVFTDLLRWCERVTRDMEKREIILSTSDEKYFCTLKVWLKGYGYDVYDVDEEHKMGAEAKENLGIDSGSHDSKGINLDISKDDSEQTENTKHPVSIPKKIIYYKTTAETVNAVYALAKAKEIDGKYTCVLVDKMEGAKALHALPTRSGVGWEDKAVAEAVDDGLHVVCSAVIFDDLLRLIRGWVRFRAQRRGNPG